MREKRKSERSSMKTFYQQYPSVYSSVPKARRDARAFFRQCALTDIEINDITLAVGEACNNAVEHGHAADGSFSVSSSFDNVDMVIEVADRGAGFDPAGKGLTSDPETLRLRGLGIFIMRSLMDDVCFTVHPSGTSVRLTKHVKAKSMLKDRRPRSSDKLNSRATRDWLKAFLEGGWLHRGRRGQS
jgi:serine/threonine-protein kinase RsbW